MADKTNTIEDRDGGQISRRKVLGGIAAVPVVGVASIVPAAAQEELPVSKVNRLAKELSVAMDDWCADMAVDGAPDVWKAHIYPSKHLQYPVMFEHIDARNEVATDPLVDLIAEYRCEMVDYDINCPDDSDGADAYAEVTFLPPMRRIENWSEPARTAQGAREALRLALQESENFMSSDMTPPLLRAALAYLDGEARA